MPQTIRMARATFPNRSRSCWAGRWTRSGNASSYGTMRSASMHAHRSDVCYSKRAERPQQAPRLKVRHVSNEAYEMSTTPGSPHVRENGLENLEVAAVLDFFHFQQLGWK